MRIRTGIVFVDAHQFFHDKKFEGASKIHVCTGGGGQGLYGRALEKVPEGLEVFGATTHGVHNPATNKLIEVTNGDWVLVAPSGNVIVVDDEEFKTQYLDFLGVETNS